MTAHHWVFDRSIPEDEKLLRCLAFYREGLNAGESGLATFEVLSFFKVFEVGYSTKLAVQQWVENVFPDACNELSQILSIALTKIGAWSRLQSMYTEIVELRPHMRHGTYSPMPMLLQKSGD